MESYQWPTRFLDLKREIVSRSTEECLTHSWNDLLSELASRTADIAETGPDFIPQVNFADLQKLSTEEIDASEWKNTLDEFIKVNPHSAGLPEDNKQFFYLYWTRPQVEARAHPNVMKATAWLNNLYHAKSDKALEGVDLSVPLVYADRFRIRHPGGHWGVFPPHIDDILTGNWREHDPYDLAHRLNARSSLYGRPGQATVFRTFQGWLAMSETAPTQGTIRFFPDVKLSNAYIILRPFFRPTVPMDSPDILDHKNWKFDISTADFPGISPMGPGFVGPMPSPDLHPHLRLEKTMTSVPKVNPGDMVFWHCDVVHSVEQEHTGTTDSAVMYIPAVPKTPQNSDYVLKQLQTFINGENPPDFEKMKEGTTYVGLGVEADVKEPISRIAMGLPIEVA